MFLYTGIISSSWETELSKVINLVAPLKLENNKEKFLIYVQFILQSVVINYLV